MDCNNVVYWSELSGYNRVGDFGYDCRSNGFSALSHSENQPYGVAADSFTQQLFWTNNVADPTGSQPWGYVTSANTDGSDHTVIISNVTEPRGACRWGAHSAGSCVWVATLPPPSLPPDS